ncbi:hypothetical protein A3C98_01285 [Candidatus Roizmanbacteria bacterium RIFCSPHIGHO2_02_FULL_37_15]|nr:MAG: hypothetical protein A3C98_01285 [Candidatus Roizmanbacteria bacterium RIFCSPHIGHO2_02_FULL_37_15]
MPKNTPEGTPELGERTSSRQEDCAMIPNESESWCSLLPTHDDFDVIMSKSSGASTGSLVSINFIDKSTPSLTPERED